MTRSMSETKALQSRSKQLQQSIFRFQVRLVAPNCTEFGSAQLWNACLKLVQNKYSDIIINFYNSIQINIYFHSSMKVLNFALSKMYSYF